MKTSRVIMGFSIVSFILVACCILVPFESSADPSSTVIEDGVKYTLYEGGGEYYAEVSEYDGTTQNVIIKSVIRYNETDYSVATIATDCFNVTDRTTSDDIEKRSNITSIEIQRSTVLQLTTAMFSGLPNLETVTIGEGFTDIPTQFCFRCSKLTTVELPATITRIGSSAFAYCTSLENLSLSDGLEVIMDASFEGCTGLQSVTIPNTVTTIGSRIFNQCANIKMIVLSERLTSIPATAFGNTAITSIDIPASIVQIDVGSGASTATFPSTLESFNVDSSNTVFKSIDGALFTKEDGKLFLYPAAKGGEITIDSVPDYVFQGNSVITRVVITEGVTTIGTYAFYGCTGLQSVVLPNTITEIGMSAFYGCTSLETITLPENLSIIPLSCFRGCSSLSSINLSCVTTLNNYALQGCSSLATIDLSSITTIGNGVLSECSGIISVNWPQSVTSIPEGTFSGCSSLTTVNFASVTSVGSSAFNGCTSLTEVDVSSATTIGTYAFYGCTSLERINLSDTLSRFEEGVFQNCGRLELGDLPRGLSYVGKTALSGTATATLHVGAYDTIVSIEGGATNKDKRVIGGSTLNTLILDNVTTELTAKKTISFENSPNLKTIVITERFSGTSFFDGTNGLESQLSTNYSGKVFVKTMSSSNTTYYLVIKGQAKGTLDEPQAPEGMDFAGWYKNSEYTQEYEPDEQLNANTTVYAKYVPKQYTISIFGDGIVVRNGDNAVGNGSKIEFDTTLTLVVENRIGYNAVVKMDGSVIAGNTVKAPAKDFAISCEWAAIDYVVKCMDGETEVKSIEYCHISDVVSLPAMDKAGFAGWSVDKGMLLGAQYVVNYRDAGENYTITLRAVFTDVQNTVWALTVEGEGIQGKVYCTPTNAIGTYGMITVLPGEFEKATYTVSSNGGYGIISDNCVMVYSIDGNDVTVTVAFQDVGKASEYDVSVAEIASGEKHGFKATVTAKGGYVDSDGEFAISYVYKTWNDTDKVWIYTTSGVTENVSNFTVTIPTDKKVSSVTGEFLLDNESAMLVFGFATFSFKGTSVTGTAEDVIVHSPVIMCVSEIQAVVGKP